MIKVQLGKNGSADFDIDGFLTDPFETRPTAEWTETKATLTVDEDNYVEFTGDFELGNGHTPKKFMANVNEITGYKLVVDGEVQYDAKGLALTQKQIGSLDAYAKYLYGNAYQVTGNAGNNTIVTADKDDVIDGGKGKDRMEGGLGNDTYFIDNKGDKVIEAKNGGTDTVKSGTVNVDISKLGNVEDVFLFGKSDIDAKGNGANNKITGNAGENDIWGGKGIDTLSGGDGADTFHFAKGDKRDTITDFHAFGKDQDTIDLEGFGRLKFKNIDIETFNKKHTLIDFGNGDELLLLNVKAKHIDIGDFDF